jgi:uncharacterized Rossmann fold enzyme
MDHHWSHMETRKWPKVYNTIEGKIWYKRDPARTRSSFVEQMISDATLSSYIELKRLAENQKVLGVSDRETNHRVERKLS